MKIFRAFIAAIMLVLSMIVVTTASNTAMASPLHTIPSYTSRPAVVKITSHPAAVTSYVVKNGDTLSGIAPTHKLSWQGLYCENRDTIGNDPNMIIPGQKLVLKSRTCKVPVVTEATTTVDTTPRAPRSDSTPSNPAPVSQPSGTLQSYALSLLGGNSTEYACLNGVVMIESGWNVYATNPGSGAYGIPQALPGSKMAVAGSDWQTNGYTQLRWMINIYIPSAYGTPCAALQHEHDYGWY